MKALSSYRVNVCTTWLHTLHIPFPFTRNERTSPDCYASGYWLWTLSNPGTTVYRNHSNASGMIRLSEAIANMSAILKSFQIKDRNYGFTQNIVHTKYTYSDEDLSFQPKLETSRTTSNSMTGVLKETGSATSTAFESSFVFDIIKKR